MTDVEAGIKIKVNFYCIRCGAAIGYMSNHFRNPSVMRCISCDHAYSLSITNSERISVSARIIAGNVVKGTFSEDGS